MKDLLYFEHKKQQKNGGGGGSVECSWLPTRGSVELSVSIIISDYIVSQRIQIIIFLPIQR